MQREEATAARNHRLIKHECDLTIVGGGMAGLCCAITAAREGLQVVLINDRPVLGGNASSEIRLWILGATSHLGNNNRWAREGGVVNEILVENLYRNPEGNPVLFDSILLDKVSAEPGITLLLNTVVYEVIKSDAERIDAVRAFCSQNSTQYEIHSPLFCDASGDGTLGFCSGAAFRMGAERAEEFGEGFAPSEDYGSLLGHSLYFYTKDTGRPVQFVCPGFAMKDISEIPQFRKFTVKEHGCQLWWIEFGGRLDTVHDTEDIKWELWRIVYGVWNYIKNSGDFPEAESMTLEWVGHIPGKRESRRFEGDYILTQQDLVEQRTHPDAVSYGGWAIDLHPADGIFSELPSCNQWHLKGVYQIPFRCMYSRNINNLFLAGRIISASHVAFGSTRVMATCAHSAQAVGVAAAICKQRSCLPRQINYQENMEQLQTQLLRRGQYIPHIGFHDRADLAQSAEVSASSQLQLSELPANGSTLSLAQPWGMLIPVQSGKVPTFTIQAEVEEPCELRCELRTSSRRGNFTPDVVLAELRVPLRATENSRVETLHSRLRHAALVHSGSPSHKESHVFTNGNGDTRMSKVQDVVLDFDTSVTIDQYVFLCIHPCQAKILQSDHLISGLLSLRNGTDKRVATSQKQEPPTGIGIDSFELWCPKRRPLGKNFSLRIEPPLDCFGPSNVLNGFCRPTIRPNAWVASLDDEQPRLTLRWSEPQTLGAVELSFDPDFDHPMETVLMGHPERIVPYCVKRFRLLDDQENVLAQCKDNYQTRQLIKFDKPLITSAVHLELASPSDNVPAALMEIRCYPPCN